MKDVAGLEGMLADAFAGTGGFGNRRVLVQATPGGSHYRVVACERMVTDTGWMGYVNAQLVVGDFVVANLQLTRKVVTRAQVRAIKSAISRLPGWVDEC